MMQIVIDTIQKSPNQCITFADFMNLVLYHPQQGYYSSGQVNIGSQGDFFTASSLGADFGELLAEQFWEMAGTLGFPEPFHLVEVGAGSGILASDILDYLSNKYPDFYATINYLIIEESQGLIEQQKKQLKDIDKITWKSWQEVADSSIIGCIFSNELIDAFPVHRVVSQNHTLKEVYVTFTDNQLQEIFGDLSTSQLANYFKLVDIDLTTKDYPENYQTEVNLNALDWLKIVAQKLKIGYLLTLDYGYSAAKYYHPQRYRGTLNCYYQHHHHHNPYVNLGKQDITAHVDFTALEKQGQLLGLETLGLTKQGLFLMALGLGDRLSALSNGQYSLSDVLTRRDALHQLIDPTGLGGFQVLIQGKGLDLSQKQRSLTGLKMR